MLNHHFSIYRLLMKCVNKKYWSPVWFALVWNWLHTQKKGWFHDLPEYQSRSDLSAGNRVIGSSGMSGDWAYGLCVSEHYSWQSCFTSAGVLMNTRQLFISAAWLLCQSQWKRLSVITEFKQKISDQTNNEINQDFLWLYSICTQ